MSIAEERERSGGKGLDGRVLGRDAGSEVQVKSTRTSQCARVAKTLKDIQLWVQLASGGRVVRAADVTLSPIHVFRVWRWSMPTRYY